MSELVAPFTKEEYIAGAFNLVLPENQPQVRPKPRVSGILDCSRQQAYMMANVPRSDPEEEDPTRAHQTVTNEMHRVDEDVTVDIVRNIVETKGFGKYLVVGRQEVLPLDYPLTGHPDGMLVLREKFQEQETHLNCIDHFDRALDDGLVWGFEHKVIGYLQYIKLFDKGLMVGKPGYFYQALLYGDALGWDAVLFVVLADDAAATKGQRSMELRKKNPAAWASREDWHPKVQIIPLDLRPYYPLIPQVHKRAEALSAVTDPAEVKREYSGTGVFPCGYCDWKARCNIDGEGSIEIPKAPFGGA